MQAYRKRIQVLSKQKKEKKISVDETLQVQAIGIQKFGSKTNNHACEIVIWHIQELIWGLGFFQPLVLNPIPRESLILSNTK